MIEDFSKFKRLFAFGCSHTRYIWPTWADILSKEISGKEYYNFARPGSGNLFISARIAEANRRFKFSETDLVVIMWTSFTREDRYVKGSWQGQGNIFNQTLYSESWVKEFADPDGYLVRDYALIELANNYIKNLPCTSIILRAFTLEYNKNQNNLFSSSVQEQCSKLYTDNYNSLPFMDWIENNISPKEYGHSYYKTNIMKESFLYYDTHVKPIYHYEYLKYLGFSLTDTSKKYALDNNQRLITCKTYEELENKFPFTDKFNILF